MSNCNPRQMRHYYAITPCAEAGVLHVHRFPRKIRRDVFAHLRSDAEAVTAQHPAVRKRNRALNHPTMPVPAAWLFIDHKAPTR